MPQPLIEKLLTAVDDLALKRIAGDHAIQVDLENADHVVQPEPVLHAREKRRRHRLQALRSTGLDMHAARPTNFAELRCSA